MLPVFILYFILASLLTASLLLLVLAIASFTSQTALQFLIISPIWYWISKLTSLLMIKSSGKSGLFPGALCWIAIILTSLGMQLLIGIFLRKRSPKGYLRAMNRRHFWRLSFVIRYFVLSSTIPSKNLI